MRVFSRAFNLKSSKNSLLSFRTPIYFQLVLRTSDCCIKDIMRDLLLGLISNYNLY